MTNTEELIARLMETNKLKNVRLAKKISEQYNKVLFDIKKDYKKSCKIDAECTKTLYSLFDGKTLALIKGYDSRINRLIYMITLNTNWFVKSNYDIELLTNFKNMHDQEFRQWDTYTLKRIPGKGYVSSRNLNRENDFLKYNFYDLVELDKILFAKENLLSSNFGLLKGEDRNLAMNLIYYLKLIDRPNKNKELVKTI